jgi:hypothetical protein
MVQEAVIEEVIVEMVVQEMVVVVEIVEEVQHLVELDQASANVWLILHVL